MFDIVYTLGVKFVHIISCGFLTLVFHALNPVLRVSNTLSFKVEPSNNTAKVPASQAPNDIALKISSSVNILFPFKKQLFTTSSIKTKRVSILPLPVHTSV